MPKFEAGDVVQFASGGPLMTVLGNRKGVTICRDVDAGPPSESRCDERYLRAVQACQNANPR